MSAVSTKPMSMATNLTEEIALAVAQCSDLNATATTCYPTNQTRLAQGDQDVWFVWNSRMPELTQTNQVDIQLFRVDDNGTSREVYEWNGRYNPTGGEAGQLSIPIYTVLSSLDEYWTGRLRIVPLYFAIGQANARNEQPQATFELVQRIPLPLSSPSATSTPTASAPASANSQSSAPHLSAGVVVGAVLGGASAMILLLMAAWSFRRRRHTATEPDSLNVEMVDWRLESETSSIFSKDDEDMKASVHSTTA
ncbi:unnamed protein product [Peniophora sp. CBMAI 1063]|nr:unnamed protein product [Peniophora sp. CBMAI 1063]